MVQAKNRKKYIADNVARLVSRIADAESRAGRPPGSTKMLAATKNRSVEEVLGAVEAGVRFLGENRVQELLEKEPAVRGLAEMHFIGHLQRNKVRQVVGLVDLSHSLDSERLAAAIDDRAGALGLRQRVLVQVNVAGEESKSGIRPPEAEGFIARLGELENIEAVGLATIAPLADDTEDVRWVFRRLRELGESLQGSIEGFECSELSMGMTGDFEVAVEEGSTIVRIGTAIFGPRASDQLSGKEVQ